MQVVTVPPLWAGVVSHLWFSFSFFLFLWGGGKGGKMRRAPLVVFNSFYDDRNEMGAGVM